MARFVSVDPLAEKFSSFSPNNFVLNNPIRLIDPDGRAPIDCPDGNCDPPIKVAIDAGHGIDGSNNPQMDPGALGNGYQEKDLALSISKSVNTYLKSYGEETHMIRDGDLTVEGNSLTFRTNSAKENGADAFVSIHINAAGNEDASGFTVLYKGNGTNAEKNKALAKSISDNQTVMDIRGDGTTERNGLRVLNEFSSTGPAVLIEVGFITNKGDVNKMSTQSDRIGKDIAAGIFGYFNAGAPPPTPPVDSSLEGIKK